MEPQGGLTATKAFPSGACLSLTPNGAATKFHHRAAAVDAKASGGNPGGLRASERPNASCGKHPYGGQPSPRALAAFHLQGW